jgi:protein-tyrosine phosphatase
MFPFRRDPDCLPTRHRSILMVCTANICRSPIAEVALRKKLWQSGLDYDVDSAATHEYMIGMPPFTLAVATAKRRGYNITGVTARRVRPHDFRYFDLILGMCRANVDWLKAFCPEPSRRKVRLLTEYSREYRRHDVPDPYGGGVAGYELALDMIEDACDGVVRSFAARHVAALSTNLTMRSV